MPENTPDSVLSKFIEALLEQLNETDKVVHGLDIRVTKVEEKDKYKKSSGNLFWKILGVVLVAAALVVSIIALLHTANNTP